MKTIGALIGDNIGSLICAAALFLAFLLCGLPWLKALGAGVLCTIAVGALVWEMMWSSRR